MAEVGSYHDGERKEGLPESHFSFTEAATRLEADSHTDARISAHILERDSENTVQIRPNQFVVVDEPPFEPEPEPA